MNLLKNEFFYFIINFIFIKAFYIFLNLIFINYSKFIIYQLKPKFFLKKFLISFKKTNRINHLKNPKCTQ